MNRAGGITAGVLALIVGGYQAWAAYRLMDVASTYSDGLDFLVRGDTHYTTAFHDFVVWLHTEAALSGAAAIALLIGAVLLLVRKAAGWRLIVLGCVVVVAHTGVGWVVATKMLRWFIEIGAYDYGLLWFNTPSKLAIVVLSFVAPVVAVVLALHPATRQWCRADSARPMPSALRRSA
jgi:hypothetical protein